MAVSDPDWTDPCAVLAWMRPQYYKVALGLQTIEIEYAGKFRGRYGQADLARLDALMRQLEADCALKQGLKTGRRRAFTFG